MRADDSLDRPGPSGSSVDTNARDHGRPDTTDPASAPERWLRERVAELERDLAGVRRRQVDALAGDPITGDGYRRDAGAVHREVLERMPTPLLVLSEDDAVLYANGAAARFFGVSFVSAGATALARIIGEEPASRLAALRPDTGLAHGLIDAPDGAGPVRCRAFPVPLDGDVARGLQIDWDPEARLPP